MRPWALDASAGAVTWSNVGTPGDTQIRRLSIADDSVETMASGLQFVSSLASWGEDLAVVDPFAGSLLSIHADRSLETLVGDHDNFGPVVADSTAVYFGEVPASSPNGLGALRKRTTDGAMTDLYVGIEVVALTRVDDAVYFSTNDGVVHRGSVDGAPASTLFQSNGAVIGLAADDTYLYASNITASAVQRVPIGGGAVETIATDQLYPNGIAVDDDAVYWVDSNAGTVHRMLK
jgi:sugar lactone lactonase YvrE